MKMNKKILLVLSILILAGCSFTQGRETYPTLTPLPTRDGFLPTMTPGSTNSLIAGDIPLPESGFLYHGVYPGGTSGDEDDLTLQDLQSYEETVGKSAVWVYFSNNWYKTRKFPKSTADWIREAGSIPYIRLMLRPDLKYDGEETIYTLQNVIDGIFDSDLYAWCADAREFGTELLVEYGTEVNSDSFVWSGIYNGGVQTDGYGDPGLPDGPERFRDAYRHIIQICREEGALNITWVFHIDSESHPDEGWNQMENYYPGDEWIDWIGLSIYGTYRPTSDYYEIFTPRFEEIYPRIVALAPDKPIIVGEFATAKNNPFVDQAEWADDALTTITSGDYPNLIGFSWWNEAWENDDNPANNTTMRVQDNSELADLFQKFVGDSPDILGEIIR